MTSTRAPGLRRPTDDPFTCARAVADAVLYEGYLLYPYRRSSGKNRVRWQFGILAPRRWVEAAEPRPAGRAVARVAGAADSWRSRTDCLLEATPAATVEVRLRFLQLVRRQVQAARPGGGFRDVDALDVADERHLTFDEAVPHEIGISVALADLIARSDRGVGTEVGCVRRIEVPAGEDIEPLEGGEPGTGTGGIRRANPACVARVARGAGRIVRRRWPVSATVRLSVSPAPAPFRLYRLRLDVENAVTDVAPDVERPRALRRSLVAAHSLLAVRGGAFLSLLDPPTWATVAARECGNIHTYPVLAGADGASDVVLSSPIILYDHPRVAPESPGDLFDATEIDEILSLRTLTLTGDEKREARATDPRAAEILDRVDGLPGDLLARLHGAVRSLRPVRPSDPATLGGQRPEPVAVPWWDPEGDRDVRPERDTVPIGGIGVAKGSRVRLHPRGRGTDVHDMFLDGRTARVQAVFGDVDGRRHVAVLLEDDPATDLHQWYGRYYYFAPDELAPLADRPATP